MTFIKTLTSKEDLKPLYVKITAMTDGDLGSPLNYAFYTMRENDCITFLYALQGIKRDATSRKAWEVLFEALQEYENTFDFWENDIYDQLIAEEREFRLQVTSMTY